MRVPDGVESNEVKALIPRPCVRRRNANPAIHQEFPRAQTGNKTSLWQGLRYPTVVFDLPKEDSRVRPTTTFVLQVPSIEPET